MGISPADRSTSKGNPLMDPDRLQAIAARDQLWASLRALQPEIQQLALGQLDGSERERQIIQILARIVVAELGFRAEETKPGDGEGEGKKL
jgi:hypothetical protein